MRPRAGRLIDVLQGRGDIAARLVFEMTEFGVIQGWRKWDLPDTRATQTDGRRRSDAIAGAGALKPASPQ